MCDDFTEQDNARWLSLSRRDFAFGGAAAATLSMLPGCAHDRDTGEAVATVGQAVTVPTADGSADAWFVRPRLGRHPGVVLWPDIAGLREAYKTMGTRLAAAGYAVLVVNQYYRSSPAPVVATMAEWRTPEGQAKIKPMIERIDPAGIARDASAFVSWLDGQKTVDPSRKIGTLGYCMTGPFALRTAAAKPGRVGAACSFHGAALVADTADSPHLLIPQMNAALLIAIARNDDERDPLAKDLLRKAAAEAHRKAEIEVYPAQHGWCTLDSPVYDAAQADRAWARLLATFKENL